MKKQYIVPKIDVMYFSHTKIIVTSLGTRNEGYQSDRPQYGRNRGDDLIWGEDE